jgi:hypothetical protein
MQDHARGPEYYKAMGNKRQDGEALNQVQLGATCEMPGITIDWLYQSNSDDLIVFYMAQELSSFNHIYKEYLSMAYDSICHKYQLSGDKEICISKVREALKALDLFTTN